MSSVTIKPGACGLVSTVTVTKLNIKSVTVKIESSCPHIEKMGTDLQEINPLEECFCTFTTSQVYRAANLHCRHVACPVPVGIIKAIEVEAGFALAEDVEIHISKE